MVASKSGRRIYISDFSLSTNANVGAQLRSVSTKTYPASEAQVRRRHSPQTSHPIFAFTTLTQRQEKQLVQHLQERFSKAQTIEIHAAQPAIQQELLSLLWSGLSQSASSQKSALRSPEDPSSALQSSMLRAAAPRSLTSSLPDIAYINASHSPLSDLQQDICEAFYQKPLSLKLTPKQVAHYLGQLEAWLVVEALGLSPSELQRLLKSIPNCKLIYTSRTPTGNQVTREYLSKLVHDSGYSQSLHQLQNAIPTLSKLERRLLTALAPLTGIPVQQQTIWALFDNVFEKPFQKSQLVAAIATLTQQDLLCETEKGYLQIHPGAISSISLNSACIHATLVSVSNWIQAASDCSAQLGSELRLVHWAIAQTRDNGDWKALLSLLRATESVFIHQQWWGRWAQVLFWKLEAAQHLDDKSAIAWVHHQLGSRALCLGEWSVAQTHLDRALILRQSYGDAVGAAATSRHLDILIAPTTKASELVRNASSASSSTAQTQPTHSGSARNGSPTLSTGSGPTPSNLPSSNTTSNATSSNPSPIAVPVATMAPTLIKSVTTVALLTGGGGLLWTGAQQLQTALSSPQTEAVAPASQSSSTARQDSSSRNRSQASNSMQQSAPNSETEASSTVSSAEDAESDIEASHAEETSDAAKSGRSIVPVQSPAQKSPVQSTPPVQTSSPEAPDPAIAGQPKAEQPAAAPSSTTAATAGPEPTHCLVGRWTSDLSDPMRGDAFVGDRAILTTIIEQLGNLGGQDLSNDAGHIAQMLTNSDYRDSVLGRQDQIAALKAQPSSPLSVEISIRHADTQGNIELSIAEDGSLVSTYDNLSHGFDISYAFAPDMPQQSHQIRWQLNGQMTAQAGFSDQHNRITYTDAQWDIQPSLRQEQRVENLPAVDSAVSEVSQSLRPLETLQPSTYRCNDNELALNMTVKMEQQALNFVRRYRRIEG